MSSMLAEYAKNNIHKATSPRNGWVHLPCPVCGDKKRHLGINVMTGHVHCIRCGASSHINTFGCSKLPKPKERGIDLTELYSYKMEYPEDGYVMDYATTRGVTMDGCRNVAFGRGEAFGHICFIQFNEIGKPVYVQYRSIKKKHYNTPVGVRPRLNHDTNSVSSALVLVEGSVDSIRVNQATGLWTSPLCSTSLNPDYTTDIIMKCPSLVVLFLDNDKAGRMGSKKIYLNLSSLGIRTVEVKYADGDPKDPSDMKNEDILKRVVDCM